MIFISLMAIINMHSNQHTIYFPVYQTGHTEIECKQAQEGRNNYTTQNTKNKTTLSLGQ
jgi:hypothetical protein